MRQCIVRSASASRHGGPGCRAGGCSAWSPARCWGRRAIGNSSSLPPGCHDAAQQFGYIRGMNDISPPEARFPGLQTAVIPHSLKAEGWKPVPSKDYPAMIGPFLARRDGAAWEYAFLPEQRHLNIGGVVHGGMLMSFMDDVLGMTVWES